MSCTPLHYACGSGRAEVAMSLIEKGADMNASNNRGNTPLHVACMNGRTEVVKSLVGKGADMNASNNKGDTPLHVACRKTYSGKNEVAMSLIEKGADMNSSNNEGDTPLHVACRSGHTEAAMSLIEKGADMNASNNEGDTPLHVACGNGHTEVAMSLIEKGADMNASDNEGNTPLHHACEYRHTEIAMSLIEKGADIIQNNSQRPPECNQAMIDLFDSIWRSTPLLAAMHRNDMGTFQALLNDDTYDVNEDAGGRRWGGDGWTILHVVAATSTYSIYRNRMEYVTALLASGRVDVHVGTHSRCWTALHVAGSTNDVEMVRALCRI